MGNNIHWQEYLFKIMNPRIFIEGWWYSMEMNEDLVNFVEFYALETGFVEFNESRGFFRVIDYPDHMKERRISFYKKKSKVIIPEIKVEEISEEYIDEF